MCVNYWDLRWTGCFDFDSAISPRDPDVCLIVLRLNSGASWFAHPLPLGELSCLSSPVHSSIYLLHSTEMMQMPLEA